jgi:hypothetical protein
VIRFVRDFVNVLGKPCREHVELLSKQVDTSLSRGQSAGLRVHILYCSGCRRFRQHLSDMRSLGQTLAKQVDEQPGLPADVRGRLIARIDQTSKKK